ncbi:MAG TPA: transcription elongation factor GreA [Lachnospiraceae bacterium]|jgi:transcription elongation factor GreA|nr:transcription elongation factor GreA [Lachnospiraceae bacterium]HCI83809.1 transcription elongation factor GreA [Lachnospiraceae bacterium]
MRREKLTKGDVEKIQKELEHRKVVVRHQAAKEIAEAAAQGDRSENFEYYAAKKFRGENESRIRYLENVLKTAIVISDQSAADEVGVNNSVTVYDRDMEEEETYRIVTSMRGNLLENQITIESPLGKALLRHKVGDVVTVRGNDGCSYEVEIRKIDKTNDESGDSLRSF